MQAGTVKKGVTDKLKCLQDHAIMTELLNIMQKVLTQKLGFGDINVVRNLSIL